MNDHLLLVIVPLLAILPSSAIATCEHLSSRPVLCLNSPNGRYQVQFCEPRTQATDSDEGLWAVITVRDLSSGAERTAHAAQGQRGSGEFWQAFGAYTVKDGWSPDGMYFAYWRFACADQFGVPEIDVVCHSHEIAFLAMSPPPAGREELVVGRYQFAGWAPGYPHSVLELDPMSTGKMTRRLPYLNGRRPSP